MGKKNPFASQRDPGLEDLTELREFDGRPGDKRIKAMQKLVRPLGYFIHVRYLSHNRSLKRLEFWTTTGTPFSKVENTLALNKLWPPIPDDPKPRIRIKQAPRESTLDVFRRSLGRS